MKKMLINLFIVLITISLSFNQRLSKRQEIKFTLDDIKEFLIGRFKDIGEDNKNLALLRQIDYALFLSLFYKSNLDESQLVLDSFNDFANKNKYLIKSDLHYELMENQGILSILTFELERKIQDISTINKEKLCSRHYFGFKAPINDNSFSTKYLQKLITMNNNFAFCFGPISSFAFDDEEEGNGEWHLCGTQNSIYFKNPECFSFIDQFMKEYGTVELKEEENKHSTTSKEEKPKKKNRLKNMITKRRNEKKRRDNGSEQKVEGK